MSDTNSEPEIALKEPQGHPKPKLPPSVSLISSPALPDNLLATAVVPVTNKQNKVRSEKIYRPKDGDWMYSGLFVPKFQTLIVEREESGLQLDLNQLHPGNTVKHTAEECDI